MISRFDECPLICVACVVGSRSSYVGDFYITFRHCLLFCENHVTHDSCEDVHMFMCLKG
jgi:hypothetical protein